MTSGPGNALKAAMLAAFLLLAAVLAAYAGLIPAGQWQDEFQTFPEFFEQGWAGLGTRLRNWSPRPLSELLLYMYAQAVNALGAPLIPQVLSILWALLVSSALFVPWAARRAFPSRVSLRQNLLLGLGIVCLLLSTNRPAEFFYWPQSAVAYMPAVAGIFVVMWLLATSALGTRRAQWTAAAMLTISALAAEAAAILVMAFCLFAWGLAFADRLHGRPDALLKTSGMFVIPFAAAATVLTMVARGRFGAPGEIFGDPEVAHHPVPALLQATAGFFRELLAIDGVGTTTSSLLLGLLAKACFVVAAYFILRPVLDARKRASARLAGALGLACFATVFLTIAAAYYQFGMVCCQRHGTFRQALVLAGLVSLAAFAAGRRAPLAGEGDADHAPTFAILCLVAAVGLPAALSIPGVLADYRSLDKRLQSGRENWEAGMAGGDRFTYQTLAPGRVVGGLGIPEGTYTAGADTHNSIPHIIKFFGKKEATFRDYPISVARPVEGTKVSFQELARPLPQCRLDAVNGTPYEGAVARRTDQGQLVLQGWAVPPTRFMPWAGQAWVVAVSPDGKKHFFETVPERRPDVARALGRPLLGDAGFRAILDLSRLPGKQVLGILAVAGSSAYGCGISLQVD